MRADLAVRDLALFEQPHDVGARYVEELGRLLRGEIGLELRGLARGHLGIDERAKLGEGRAPVAHQKVFRAKRLTSITVQLS